MSPLLKVFLLSFIFAQGAGALEVNSLRLETKALEGTHQVQAWQGKSLVASYPLETMGHSSEVLEIKKVKDQYVYVDYFQGRSGSRSSESCYTAYLLKVSSRKLQLVDKKQYRCNRYDPKSEADSTGFSSTVRVRFKGKKPYLAN